MIWHWAAGIRAVIRTGVIPVGVIVAGLLLLAACTADAATPAATITADTDTPTPPAGARGDGELSASIATAVAEAKATTIAKLSAAGVANDYCGRMCTDKFWLTATPAEVQSELEKGVSANATAVRGRGVTTPLHLAAAYGKWPAVSALLDAGADIDAIDDDGATPLGFALITSSHSTEPRLDTIALLLERGADPNAPIKSRQGTPLHTTADPAVAALLIAYGADVNASNEYGATPLHTAKSAGVFALLLGSGADINAVDDNGATVLLTSVGLGEVKLVETLLERGMAVDFSGSEGVELLYAAAGTDNDKGAETVKLLLDRGVAVNDRAFTQYGSGTPLQIAAMSDNVAVVRLLLDHGADANVTGNDSWTLLHHALNSRNAELVETLLEHGADVNFYGGPGSDWSSTSAPILIAVQTGDAAIVEVLLRHGADINEPRRDHNRTMTPLQTAVSRNALDVAKLLLEYGADVNRAGDSESPPLYQAAGLGDVAMVATLLEHGADVNADVNAKTEFCDWAQAEMRDRPPSELPADIGEIRDLVCS